MDSPEHRILSLAELIEKDKAFDALTGGKAIEDIQRHIYEVGLASQVPEEVKRILDTAQKLCIYGWFQYIFCTVSYMIALMALESALKHRYIQFYGGKFDLVKPQEDQHWELETENYDFLWKAVVKDRWRLAEIGKFPRSFASLARWAYGKGLLTHDSFMRVTEGAVRLRNSLAHPFHQTVFTPGNAIGGINLTARLINELFSV